MCKILSNALVGLAALALLVFAPIKFAQAQAVTGTISGTVTDETGAVVPGATVVATDTATGINTTATSNSDGAFSFAKLPIGTYDVTASKAGFQTFKLAGVILNVGAVYTVKAQLSVSGNTSTVTVEANALQVQTQNTQLGAVITGNDISNMPLINRNPIAL